MYRAKASLIALSCALLVAFVAGAGAQGTVQRFSRIFINGNEVRAGSGTAVLTLPTTTQTLLGTTNLCTSGNWCQATITLTDAQIKALPTTGITAIAAPASGHRVKLLGGSAEYVIAGAYTNINGTYADIHLEYGTSGKYVGLLAFRDTATTTLDIGAAGTDLVTVLTTVSNTLGEVAAPPFWTDSYWPYLGAGQLMATTDADANAVTVKADNNGSGAFTGGNASNSLKLNLYYVIDTL